MYIYTYIYTYMYIYTRCLWIPLVDPSSPACSSGPFRASLGMGGSSSPSPPSAVGVGCLKSSFPSPPAGFGTG